MSFISSWSCAAIPESDHLSFVSPTAGQPAPAHQGAGVWSQRLGSEVGRPRTPDLRWPQQVSRALRVHFAVWKMSDLDFVVSRALFVAVEKVLTHLTSQMHLMRPTLLVLLIFIIVGTLLFSKTYFCMYNELKMVLHMYLYIYDMYLHILSAQIYFIIWCFVHIIEIFFVAITLSKATTRTLVCTQVPSIE